MHNLFPSSSQSSPVRLLGTRVDLVLDRLDALLMVLKSCRGGTCVAPWQALHPRGDVASLADALAPRFDAFYRAQVRVAFDRCALGYLVDAEGPQARDVTKAYHDEGDYNYRAGTRWFDWV